VENMQRIVLCKIFLKYLTSSRDTRKNCKILKIKCMLSHISHVFISATPISRHLSKYIADRVENVTDNGLIAVYSC